MKSFPVHSPMASRLCCRRRLGVFPLLVVSVWLASAAGDLFADVVHDEFQDGDLSNGVAQFDDEGNFQGYTGDDLGSLPIGSGDGGIGSVIGRTDVQQVDLFTIEVDPDFVLSELILENYANGDGAMFMAVQDGDLFPENYFTNPSEFTALSGTFLGYSTVGTSEIGTNVLDNLGALGRGFDGPLGPGRYTFYVQQTGPINDYQLDFVTSITSVPEPGSIIALSGIAGVIAWRHRRRRRG